MLANEEIALSEAEAKALAEASANVARYYSPLKVTGPTGAWFGLAGTCALIYGPRIISASRRRRAMRQGPIENG